MGVDGGANIEGGTPGLSNLRQIRIHTLVCLAFITPLGFATKIYGGPGALWANSYAGGVLYVLFWVLVVVFVRPRTSPWIAATLVLGATCILEALQLFSTPALVAVRSTFLGHALIGSTFSWWDFPYYVLGALLGAAVARLAARPAGLAPFA